MGCRDLLPRTGGEPAGPCPRAGRGIHPKLIVIGVGAAVLLAVGLIVAGEVTREDDVGSPVSASVYPGVPREGQELGRADAKVIVEVFADFQCPACKAFFESIEPRLIADYVATSKVKLVFRDFAFLGSESTAAAASARCASDQGKFWEYHNALYTRQGAENSGAFYSDRLTAIARDTGVDAGRFDECRSSARHVSAVDETTREGRVRGVKVTPTIVVNGGTVLEGVPTYEELRRAIDAALGGG